MWDNRVLGELGYFYSLLFCMTHRTVSCITIPRFTLSPIILQVVAYQIWDWFFRGPTPGYSPTDWPQQPFPINAAVTRLSCLTLGSVIRLHLSFCSTWIRCVISVKNTASCHESCRSCVLLHKTRADNSWHNDFTIHHTVMSTTFLFINFAYLPSLGHCAEPYCIQPLPNS